MDDKNVLPESSNRAEEILSELSECREDERNAQNQMIQVIATAGTILTFIFGVATFFEEVNKSILFHLSNLVLCTAFGYITSLGIHNVLRYHYVENLEDEISKLSTAKEDENKLIHWMSFSMAITTRNPTHLYNKYSKLHYIYYALATICPIIFCISLTVYQYLLLEEYNILDKLGITLLFVFMLFSFVAFFFSSIKARQMFKDASIISRRKRNMRLNLKENSGEQISEKQESRKEISEDKPAAKKKISKKDMAAVIIYFFYPKKKDAQKPMLIVLGFFTGIFLKEGSFYITLEEVFCLIIVWLIIDFLLYQARYLWNDIRGVREDSEAGKNGRLPVNILGKKAAVNLSLIVIFLRMSAAVILIAFMPGNIRMQLILPALAILLCSVIYEAVRTKEKVIGIFITVSFGYMIRFAAGALAAWPEMIDSDIMIMNHKIPHTSLLLLLAAYVFLGGFSAVLPWTHEALCQIRGGNNIQKKHHAYLFDSVKSRTKEDFQPLKEKGRIKDLWNAEYTLSMILLSAINLITDYSIVMLAAELVTVFISIMLCITSYKNAKWILGLFIGSSLLKTAAAAFLYENSFLVYIYCTQLGFTLLYFVLRYLFDPDFDAVVLCIGIVREAYILMIGKNTWDYLNEKEERADKQNSIAPYAGKG